MKSRMGIFVLYVFILIGIGILSPFGFDGPQNVKAASDSPPPDSGSDTGAG